MQHEILQMRRGLDPRVTHSRAHARFPYTTGRNAGHYSVSHATEGASFSFATAIVATSGSATPFFTAVISARIDTAISGGVRLPM